MKNDVHTSRYYELDLLRFIAASMVLLYHYCFTNPTLAVTHVAYPELSWFSMYGFYGVPLFFVISGFVIPLSADGKTPGQFVASRAGRLYPAFWAACSLTFATAALLSAGSKPIPAVRYLINMTMMSGWVGGDFVDGVYWTLFVEMRFYLLVFLALTLKLSRRQITAGLVAWLLLSIVNFEYYSPLQRILTLNKAPYFVIGMVCYSLFRGDRRPLNYVILLVSMVMAHAYELREFDEATTKFGVLHDHRVLLALETACFGIFILFAHKATERFGAPWMRVAGALTYPLYLTHAVIGEVIFNRLYPFLGRWTLLLGIAATMLVVAYLINVLVERPLSPLVRRGTSDIINFLTATSQSSFHRLLGTSWTFWRG
jgi:peptidoglycan/LPS O-acetylase OafA/YrhL